MRAMSLVFTTILSIVPLLALSVSILKALEFHYELAPVLNNIFAPLGADASVLTQRVVAFVDNVKGSTLRTFGLVFLIITVVSMVHKVEESFNFVWQVAKSRSLARRFSEFLSVILVAPVIVIVLIGLIGTLSIDTLIDKLLKYEWIAGSTPWLRHWTPIFFVSLAFTFLYGFIPNTKVSFKAALIGGIAGGITWTAASELFSAIVANSTKYTAIYSTFAILITALIWLYIGWLILLVGAKVSFYVQNPQYLRHGRQNMQMGNTGREELAIALMHRVAVNHQQAHQHMTVNQIASSMQTTGHVLEPIADLLKTEGFLTESETAQLMPAMDIGKVKVRDVLNVVRRSEPFAVFPKASTLLMARVSSAIDDHLGDMSIRDLVNAEEGASESRENTELPDQAPNN